MSSAVAPRIDIIGGVTMKRRAIIRAVRAFAGAGAPGQSRADEVGEPLENIDAHGARPRTR
jgi:hypothetical protein